MSTSPSLPAYQKPWLSISEQLRLLQSRGLLIPDVVSAEKFLKHVGYYRLSGFCLAFEDSRHKFRSSTTFEQVKAAYEFDAALRDLLTEALEVIEIDARGSVATIFGEKYGAFGHTFQANFRNSFRHAEWKAKLDEETSRSSELFVIHFKNNYQDYPNLPCWIATELMSFGTLSKMYLGLLDQCKTPIAGRYSLQKRDFESILHHLSYVRNICAHHCRLWDRVWSITPRVPAGHAWQSNLITDHSRMFVTLLMIYRILKCCSSMNDFAKEWRKRVNGLLKNPPAVPNALSLMGMATKWYEHPLWS